MAELKEFSHLEMERVLDEAVEESNLTSPVVTKSKATLKNISRIEKLAVSLLLVAVLGLAVVTVKLTTTISQAEEDISVMQLDINDKTEKITKLEQKKNEMSRTDKIKAAAEKAGLVINDENIRNVD
ncbi:cell division protein FtsL [Vagococcus sp. PNs007]|uniref:Cell division protein FtsL n=1 Tax=Vagococcus proximus TaxID=2991417 RepID=A0ABT5X0B4_9ENTE|nr:cell division protein FtsL [Vagococcus proximus]MDF0479424.1 cell division protein FtsL [Vagococcus proximus]